MTLKAASTSLLLLAVLFGCASAVWTGDEMFQDEDGGLFYGFGVQTIIIFNASDLSIQKQITTCPFEGCTLPSSWGDTVYAEDPEEDLYYIFAADRTNNKMIVIDTIKQEIVSVLDVGARPVHVYSVTSQGEVWVHSDGLGHFDILKVSDVSKLSFEELNAKVKLAGHGKLLFDEELGDAAYATNTNEPGIYQLDLKTKEHGTGTPTFYNLTDLAIQKGLPYICTGTHGLAYSPINQHIYVECSGRGTWEFSHVSKELITVWPTIFGQIYQTLPGDYVVAVDKTNSLVYLLEPGISEENSTIFQVVSTPGKPDKPAFWRVPDRDIAVGSHTIHDYIGFFALTTAVDAEAGVAWVDFETALSELDPEIDGVLAAGEVTQGAFFTHRSIKKGGTYIVTETQSPTNGIAVINAATFPTAPELVGVVSTTAVMSKATYAPPRSLSSSGTDTGSADSAAGVSLTASTLVVVVLLSAMILF